MFFFNFPCQNVIKIYCNSPQIAECNKNSRGTCPGPPQQAPNFTACNSPKPNFIKVDII